ncbi:hypothetical protein [Streptomyces sp. NPDC050263]|uniref:hypothetical protein n=1 Tax=Streptomyces sp. NPDC050263 TaxID=3155037 RepID=UPI003429360D
MATAEAGAQVNADAEVAAAEAGAQVNADADVATAAADAEMATAAARRGARSSRLPQLTAAAVRDDRMNRRPSPSHATRIAARSRDVPRKSEP